MLPGLLIQCNIFICLLFFYHVFHPSVGYMIVQYTVFYLQYHHSIHEQVVCCKDKRVQLVEREKERARDRELEVTNWMLPIPIGFFTQYYNFFV